MKNIKIKLILYITLIILFSTTLLGFYNYKDSENLAIDIIKENNKSELKNISDYYFNKLISDMEHIVNVWSKKPEIYNFSKKSNKPKIVNEIPASFENIYDKWIGLVDSYEDITWIYYAWEGDGSIFIAPVDETMPLEYDSRTRNWYMGTLKEKDTVHWTKPYIDAGDSNKLLQTVSKAVYDESGTLKGVIGLDIELSKFTEIIKELSYAQNSYVFLLNQDNDIIGHNSPKNNSFYKEIIKKYKVNSNSKIIKENNTQYVLSSVNIDLNNWRLVSLTQTDLKNQLISIRKKIIGMVIVSVCISIFIALHISKSLLLPLENLVKVTDSLSSGNFNVRSNVKSKDEFYKLSQSFNKMIDKIKSLLKERDENYINTIQVIANAIEASDSYTKGHCDRVGEISLKLAEDFFLSEDRLKNLKLACILHDVGKIGVPDSILNKPNSLTDKEYETIKKHPTIGYDIISEIEFLKKPAKILLQHHERIDGKGYPNNLIDDEILLEAKILAVADAYDAMTSARVYKKKTMSFDEIIQELELSKNNQFDEKIIDLLITKLENKGSIL